MRLRNITLQSGILVKKYRAEHSYFKTFCLNFAISQSMPYSYEISVLLSNNWVAKCVPCLWTVGSSAVTRAQFGQGTGQIWLDNLVCTGTEARLVDCGHNSFGTHNCNHNEDAGIRCIPDLCKLELVFAMHACEIIVYNCISNYHMIMCMCSCVSLTV